MLTNKIAKILAKELIILLMNEIAKRSEATCEHKLKIAVGDMYLRL